MERASKVFHRNNIPIKGDKCYNIYTFEEISSNRNDWRFPYVAPGVDVIQSSASTQLLTVKRIYCAINHTGNNHNNLLSRTMTLNYNQIREISEQCGTNIEIQGLFAITKKWVTLWCVIYHFRGFICFLVVYFFKECNIFVTFAASCFELIWLVLLCRLANTVCYKCQSLYFIYFHGINKFEFSQVQP